MHGPGPLLRPSRAGALAAVTVLLALPAVAAAQGSADDSVASAIRMRVEAGRTTGEFWARGQRLTAVQALPDFYRGRAFRSAWTAAGRPSAALGQLVRSIEEAAGDGLDPAAYHLGLLRELRVRGSLGAADAADLELLATDAFLVLGSHLLHGRVDPVRVRAEWLADRRGADMAAVLESALEKEGVEASLDALRPRQPRYHRMRRALAELRDVEAAGGWPRVAEGPTLRLGDDGERVRALRKRLALSGDLRADTADAGAAFDGELEAAVRRFQARHGLDEDGAVGPATRAALNVPVEDRIDRLVVNLERWRWMPAELGPRHILVNIPAFQVVVRDGDEPVLRLRAIVGREYRQTPVFSGRMTYLVLAPFWHVPPGIAGRDKLPEIRRDPSYIAAQRMTLLDLRTNRPVDPRSVDWSTMTAAQFNQRYRLRQDPGPQNALGDVKFMFPNPYNVYLHDTPTRELFGETERAFSSGCIRVENPLELASFLLREDPSWTPDRIRRTVEGGAETTAALTAAVPVHLQYWTAFVDEDGRLNYRRDLYDRDAAVLAALRAPPPGL